MILPPNPITLSYMHKRVPSVARAWQQPMRNLNQRREIHQRITQKTRTTKQERKTNTIFNEIRQFAYVLEAREREILLIQQSITICSLLQGIFKGDFQ